jgi:NADH-quinone oxidoreductase subunit H
MVGETNRLPFDLAEGEGEIVGGYFTEYSGMRFAMFFLGEYINMFSVAALATTMFLGGWQAPPGIAAINDGMFNQGWWGLLWFTIKLWLFMFFFVWLRGSLPRVRYDQFMRFGWKFLIPATLSWVVLIAVFRAGRNGWFDSVGTVDCANRSFPVVTLGLIGLVAVVGARRCLAVGHPDRGQGSRRPPAHPRRGRPLRGRTPRAAAARPDAWSSPRSPPPRLTADSETKEAVRG